MNLLTEMGGFHVSYRCTTTKLIDMQGRQKAKQQRQEVWQWFKRMTGTLIEGAIYRAKKKDYDEGFVGTVFSQVIMKGESMETAPRRH